MWTSGDKLEAKASYLVKIMLYFILYVLAAVSLGRVVAERKGFREPVFVQVRFGTRQKAFCELEVRRGADRTERSGLVLLYISSGC